MRYLQLVLLGLVFCLVGCMSDDRGEIVCDDYEILFERSGQLTYVEEQYQDLYHCGRL